MAEAMTDKKHMLATSAVVRAQKNAFGRKTLALAMLEEAGYRVPKFVAVPSSVVLQIALREMVDAQINDLALSAHEGIGANSYAVRSGAFAEDGTTSTHAGEFLTLLDIAPYDIKDAVIDVVRDATAKGYATKTKPFSVIIQEYVPAEHAGVIFTRDPRGGREAVVEWRAGRGAEVVGGSKVSRMYINDDARIFAEQFRGNKELFSVARQIEEFFDAPQDIEWVISEGTLHILQSRPVTTISQDLFHSLKLVDDLFRSKAHYYLSRSGAGEAFTLCTPLALDVLLHLYAPHGPIHNAYRTIGVSSNFTPHFHILHGALYVDQERELHQFFPAFDYVESAGGMMPQVTRFSGLLETLANSYRLSHLHIPSTPIMRKKIKSHLQHIQVAVESGTYDVHETLALIRRVYPDIFFVNLFAEDVFRKTQKELRKILLPLSTLLHLPIGTLGGVRIELLTPHMRSLMVGNSIDIADDSKFVARTNAVKPSDDVMAWWNTAMPAERSHTEHWITLAREYQSMREEGRLLTVLLMSMLRTALHKQSLVPQHLLYFATLDELTKGKVTQSELVLRKEQFDATARKEMPRIIASVPPKEIVSALGVSPGVATGIVVVVGTDVPAGAILLVDRLSPDLAPLLGTISGMIATEGGLLSHMAIVAREHGIPVVVDGGAHTKVRAGMRVTIDGAEGGIFVHDEA